MDVTAIFELPVHIWVKRDAFNKTYSSGHGEVRFDVVMPDDRDPIGGPPDVAGISDLEAGIGEQIIWAQEYAGFIPESLRPATAALRLVITNVRAPHDEDRSWRTADQQLAEHIDGWFDDVRTWVEVATGQDLDPNHRVYDAEEVGSGLTFIEPPHDNALGLIITTPSLLPLTAAEWKGILAAVRDGQQPPLEEVLSRDARAAHRRRSTRRAIIDAATALEIALGRHIRAHLDQLPEKQRARINDRTSLGDWISIAEHSGLELAVSVERLREISREPQRRCPPRSGTEPPRSRPRHPGHDRLLERARHAPPQGRARARRQRVDPGR